MVQSRPTVLVQYPQMRCALLAMLAVSATAVAAPPAWAADPRTGAELARSDLGTAALLLLVAGWIGYAALWFRFARTPRPAVTAADDDGPVLELPDDPPAVVDALRHDGTARTATLGIVLLDLARRGYLEIEEIGPPPGGDAGSRDDGEGRTWVFRRLEMPRGSLAPYENAVYTRVFATGSVVTLGDLDAWVRANRQQARVWIERVRRAVAGELTSKGYVERAGRFPVFANLAASGVVGVVGLAALASGSWWGVAALASAAYQASLSGRLRRRSTAGSARALEWVEAAGALTRVDEVSRRGRKRIDWEPCLVAAVALGVPGQFLDALRRRDEEVVTDPGFAAWYRSPSDDRLEAAGEFPERFGRALTAAVEGSEESASGVAGVGRFSAWASRSR